VFQSSFRAHSAAYLVGHLAHLKATYGIRHVNIYDDNFLLKRARVEEFCTRLLESGLKTSFSCIGRVDALDADLLRLMKRAGCWMISLGVESGDEEVLAPHRLNSNLHRTHETVALIRASGIRAKGLFMLGIPGETEASFSKTLAFALDNKFDDLNLTKFTPFPGAPIHAEIARHGEFTEDWEKMNCIETVFVPAGFTRERIAELYYEFYGSFYDQPRVRLAYLTMLWKSPQSWWRLLKDLPQFLAARRRLNPA
jgi:radical SAM superfamily enzyme YgiQ (UPF0313 family)